MTSATQPDSAAKRLQKQLPPPPVLRDLIADNRRERVLLRRLLHLSERIYATEESLPSNSDVADKGA